MVIEKAVGRGCDVMAESFGGWIAMWLAVKHPELVEQLVLEAPAGMRTKGVGGLPPNDPTERNRRLYAVPERAPKDPRYEAALPGNFKAVGGYTGGETLDAELLLPGHGPPILGARRVRAALSDTAELLETLCEQTLRLMNGGARLDDVLHSVALPAHLLERPYLRPSYDDPRFIVRSLWRLYGGWWDGNPAHLLPAPEADLAVELAALAGGAGALAARAEKRMVVVDGLEIDHGWDGIFKGMSFAFQDDGDFHVLLSKNPRIVRADFEIL